MIRLHFIISKFCITENIIIHLLVMEFQYPV